MLSVAAIFLFFFVFWRMGQIYSYGEKFFRLTDVTRNSKAEMRYICSRDLLSFWSVSLVGLGTERRDFGNHF